jgi:hypothetical protein
MLVDVVVDPQAAVAVLPREVTDLFVCLFVCLSDCVLCFASLLVPCVCVCVCVCFCFFSPRFCCLLLCSSWWFAYSITRACAELAAQVHNIVDEIGSLFNEVSDFGWVWLNLVVAQ